MLNKKDIETLLHHRRPYLMVDEVIEISSEYIHSSKDFSEVSFLSGHFPGAPVVPGAMLQEMATQSAGILMTKFYAPEENYNSEKTKGWAIGVLNKIVGGKFYNIVKPDFPVTCKVELIESNDNLFKFSARIFQNDHLQAKLMFNLVITSDEILY